jgi:hypothetical protein
MSYIVNKTDGSVLATLSDGTTNTETGLTLIGRNYTSYGEIQNENFVRLLENFSNTLPPGQSVGFAPISGQLWWDTGNQRLRVYTGTEFVNVSENYVGATAPVGSKVGDQWWDTTNKQLKVNDGVSWALISPLYTSAQGKSGAIVETVTDTNLNTHTVVNTYTNNQLISVASYDPTFQTSAYDQFSIINPGITLASNVAIYGSATNSLQLGGLAANLYPRTTTRTNFLSDLGIDGNLVMGNANVSFVNTALVVQNTALNGNVEFYVNTTSFGNTRALRINGTTGMLTVASNPTTALGIATKAYTDDIQLALDASIVSNVANINSNVSQLRSDIYSSLTSNVIVLNATIDQVESTSSASILSLDNSFSNSISDVNSNLANKTGRIESLEAQILLKSTINSPAFTGSPTAPTTAPNNNSTRIATTAYVDSSAGVVTNYIETRVDALASLTASNLASGLAAKSNIVSPAFIGVATAETPPALDNSTRIATTAHVRAAITGDLSTWQGSRYTVSTSGPSGGNDGDFWFQIG